MQNVWIDRFNACSKARAQYWWILAIVSLFYLALTSRLRASSGDLNEITLPFLGMPLDALVVWAAGPTVISLLLVGILGVFKARLRALTVLSDSLDEADLEAVEHALTFVDFVAYEPEKAWAPLRAVKQLVYPLSLTLFFSEAVVLLWQLWQARGAVHYWPVFIVLGVITCVAAGIAVVNHWVIYVKLGRAIFSHSA